CSLAELLAMERGVRNLTSVPRLTKKQSLAWADAHCRRTGEWPTQLSGPIPESPDDRWWAVAFRRRCQLDPAPYTYSLFFTLPGCGTAYLPSSSARSGDGESSVSLARSGANSCSQVSIWS